MLWRLPDGELVEKRGDEWMLWHRPGILLYSGDAEGIMQRVMSIDLLKHAERVR